MGLFGLLFDLRLRPYHPSKQGRGVYMVGVSASDLGPV
jgi:hypothetical protein